jgi:hypothetical protein
MSSVVDHYPVAIANDNEGRSAFIIETGGTAAGVVVRDGRKYRFFSAHNDFRTLDGQAYATPGAAQKAADLLRAGLNRKGGRSALLTQ